MIEKYSPIEAVEQIQADAVWLDRTMGAELEPLSRDETIELLVDIEKNHPLIGEDVLVYGRRLAMGADQNTFNPLLLAPEDMPGATRPVHGIYHGYDLRRVYISSANDNMVKVVQVVETGEDSYRDEYQNVITRKTMDYVLAEGSTVLPTFPKDVHSLPQLEGSKSIDVFDELIYDEDLDILDKLKHLGRYANSVFANQSHLMDVNYQRVSYLNASKLLEDVDVYSDSFLMADRLEYIEGREIPKIGRDKVGLRSPTFDIMPGYVFQQDGAIRPWRLPELFVGVAQGTERLAVPVKDIVEARPSA